MGGDLTNNCPLQLLMTYQSARNTPKNPMHWATSRRRASYIMTSAQRPLMAHANVTRISLKLCFYFPNVAAAQRGFSSDISAAIDGRILQRLSSRDGSGDWCWWRNLGHHGDLWKRCWRWSRACYVLIATSFSSVD